MSTQQKVVRTGEKMHRLILTCIACRLQVIAQRFHVTPVLRTVTSGHVTERRFGPEIRRVPGEGRPYDDK